jgi:HD-GYP domain-containing protein (c-di-GMP phosphodiesterase class II)
VFDEIWGAFVVLILPIEDAKAGMSLAAPVTHPDYPDQELLKSGYVLEEHVLGRLRELGISSIYIGYPGLDDLDRHLAVNLSPARQKLYSQIKETIIAGQKRIKPAVSFHDYYTTTRELIITLLSQGQHPVYMEHMSRMGNDAIAHATAVAHIGLVLGIKLERYLIKQRRRLPAHHAKEVVNIGVAGMLHDMGKLALREELQQHTAINPPAQNSEREEWENHSILGYKMIRNGVEPTAASAVAHHHQRWDGKGFPSHHHRDGSKARANKERIHVFARILAVADLYDRLATSPDTAGRRSNLEVLNDMRTRYASWCDPVVLDTLQAVAPPFPPGSILTLSDDSPAVVVDIDPVDPYRPIVKRIVGDDWQVEDKRLSLRAEGAPTITHVGKTPVDGMIPPPRVEEPKRKSNKSSSASEAA